MQRMRLAAPVTLAFLLERQALPMRGLVAALALAGAVVSAYRPSFDHQTK